MRGLIAASLILAAAASAPGAAQAGIFGCDAGGGKQEGGAVIGAIVGGVIGNQVADDNRALGTAIGAGIGAAIGSSIGCKMQEGDQKRAEAALEEALRTGRPTSWRNPNTGAHGEIRMLPTGSHGAGYGKPIRLNDTRFASGVDDRQIWVDAGGGWYAPKVVNLRAGPSTRSPIIGRLQAGESFQALAKVDGKPWLLVGRGGKAIGYASESVVRPGGEATCRAVEQTIYTRQNGSETERLRACRKPSGSWKLSKL